MPPASPSSPAPAPAPPGRCDRPRWPRCPAGPPESPPTRPGPRCCAPSFRRRPRQAFESASCSLRSVSEYPARPAPDPRDIASHVGVAVEACLAAVGPTLTAKPCRNETPSGTLPLVCHFVLGNVYHIPGFGSDLELVMVRTRLVNSLLRDPHVTIRAVSITAIQTAQPAVRIHVDRARHRRRDARDHHGG